VKKPYKNKRCGTGESGSRIAEINSLTVNAVNEMKYADRASPLFQNV
jgi:hypothetical protein